MENEFNNMNIPPQGEEEPIIGGFIVEESVFDDDEDIKIEDIAEASENSQTENIAEETADDEFSEDEDSEEIISIEEIREIINKFGLSSGALEEKRDLKKSTRAIGIASIAIMVFSAVWASILYFVMGLLGFSSFEVYNFISEPAMLQYISVFMSLLMFTVPYIFAAKLTRHRISDLLPMGKAPKGKFLPYFLLGLGFCAFANIATSMAGQIFSNLGFEYSVDTGDLPKGIFGFFLSVLGTSLIPGFIEEFACRGIMFGMLKKHGDTFAIFASAAVFGLLHGNFIQIPFAFLVGLVLGLIRAKTGTMWVCFAVHAANNFVSVVFDRISENLSVMQGNCAYMVYLILSMLAAILGMSMLREKDEFTLPEPKAHFPKARKYKLFFASPVIIIFAVICLLESCLYFFN